MKKLLTMVLVVICVSAFCFTGCSSADYAASQSPSEPAQASEAPSESAAVSEAPSESASEAPGEAAATGGFVPKTTYADGSCEGITIAFANASISNSWRVTMRDMLKAECDRLGITLEESDAHDDANTQNSNIEMMLQKKPDAMLISPAVEDAVNPGIEQAYESGIPVIIFDRHASTDKYTHFVGYSDKQNAVECAQLMVDALTEKYGEPKGNLIALDSIAGSSTDNLNKEGWDEVLSQYPDIKIVARQYTDFEASKGKSFMEDTLTKFGTGQIDGILSQDGVVTLAAYDAIKEAGRESDNIFIVNADGVNGVAQMVKDGTCIGFTELPCAASVDALQVALDIINGKETSKDQSIIKDSIVVTKDNVDTYLIPGGDPYAWTM
ncbi:MAG: substrate-binding domain-containing protein [Christensenella sp.]|uniref:substrate-binding domain-containing protein n=1 Tax=Christensenella sp. TaxID=1935934 RepID=UPI002B1F82A3|nr:substrate-binding domain-containing protein [Christensenella sp.]MEA5004559.1 substrate-binding domain-containing protein [Christensenella sp.]